MSRKRSLVQKIYAQQAARNLNLAVCKQQGHLMDFVKYLKPMDTTHAPWCPGYWPKVALCRCRRCKTLQSITVRVPESARYSCHSQTGESNV